MLGKREERRGSRRRRGVYMAIYLRGAGRVEEGEKE